MRGGGAKGERAGKGTCAEQGACAAKGACADQGACAAKGVGAEKGIGVANGVRAENGLSLANGVRAVLGFIGAWPRMSALMVCVGAPPQRSRNASGNSACGRFW